MDRYIELTKEGVTCDGSFCPIFTLYMNSAECEDCLLITLLNNLEAIKYDGVY